MRYVLKAEDIACPEQLELARRVASGGGIPRRACTGFRSTGVRGNGFSHVALGYPSFWAYRLVCACGRELEPDGVGYNWGCSACR